MRLRSIPVLLAGLILALLPLLAWAAEPPADSATAAAAEKQLVVGVTDAPPFVIDAGNGDFQGLGIELWQEAAADNGWTYELRKFDLKGLLQAVEQGKVDVGIGAITTTAAREKVMDFGHPVTSSGLGVAVRDEAASGWLAVIQAILSPAFLKVIITLSILLLIVGFVVWLFEHKRNPEQFGGSKPQGIFSGFWWAMVTMTTVGYGDTAPATVGGRIVGMVWMLTALIVVSFFTAAMTSALTVGQLSQRISNADELGTMRLASVPDSTSAEWLKQKGWHFSQADNLKAALSELAAGKVDAVVYDKALMQWLVKQNFDGRLNVLPLILERQDYAFAMPQGSPLRQQINTAILKRINAPDWSERMQAAFELPQPASP